MMFWIFAALLTLAASLAVMRPFLRKSADAAHGDQHDIAVYRDQLAELERERERGLLDEGEAEEARAEIGRRILGLQKSDASQEAANGNQGALVKVVAIAAVLSVPVVSWATYQLIGRPDIPAQPLAARLEKDPAQASLDELVARAENYLAENPQDARGWDTLGPVYIRLGRYRDAANAFRKAIDTAGGTAEREAALGEALVGVGEGVVTGEAEAAFIRAREHDPANPRARFYLGMAAAQEGDSARAGKIWRALAEELDDASPWKGAAASALADLTGGSPSQNDDAATDSNSAYERQQMIEGMVASLDAKLRDNPRDAEGWRRLIRSYVVLNKPSEAKDALDRAVAAFGAGSEEADALNAFAKELGVSSTE
ncbi:c-type cytochrome biogenesis protein CcmI [Nitratireductor luteus]|uniref:c-type cytochrome biogenesis protein CcmI n=1 Tax=Nitratireductor luteus TaxID=2976980 RepID=UPI00223F1CBC|nr:c-type cytochrome biogenesis protein CcmI [Nitratireductor luteus]